MIAPRPLDDRISAARRRLSDTHQLWLASGGSGGPHMIPVAFVYDDGQIVTATAERSRTVANLRESQRARLALGTTDDVVMVDASLERFETVSEISQPVADRFAAVSHDPRHMPGYLYIRLCPTRIQVWNGYHEFAGRTVMLAGNWLTSPVD
ncbi:pyridoxamine 5'-phosphate oxidase family protein [Pseudonocardia phyllosphaerae]|uniref:pyridoxamine 5'-phosphate oxidase family protein n=1 Tax=Pseudonocardia phyllosphaerae TaxID=3390502 RepID=UPI00397B5ED8